MSEPYAGEIRMFAGNFAPRGWAFCDGQLLGISQNDALFSLFGTFYGGDGRTNFGLPDLRGRIPIDAGQGPGLNLKRLGQKGGAENVTLTTNQIPAHTHTLRAATGGTPAASPVGNLPGQDRSVMFVNTNDSPTNFASNLIGNNNGSRSHTNMMPFLCVHFIVALFGIYPSSN